MSLPAALVAELSALLGEGWRMDDATRVANAGDDSRRHALPDAVALPRNREEVLTLVRACRAHRVPAVARGAGTGYRHVAWGVPVDDAVPRLHRFGDLLALTTTHARPSTTDDKER